MAAQTIARSLTSLHALHVPVEAPLQLLELLCAVVPLQIRLFDRYAFAVDGSLKFARNLVIVAWKAEICDLRPKFAEPQGQLQTAK